MAVPVPHKFRVGLQRSEKGHMPNFDFHAKHVFLTYPQSGAATADDALPILAGLGEGRVSFVVVSREQHQDGGNHLHSLVCFKVQLEPILLFDVTLRGPQTPSPGSQGYTVV